MVRMLTNPALFPDKGLIERFLEKSLRTQIHLVAIRPDGPTRGKWFGFEIHLAAAWAADRNSEGNNVYWTVNVAPVGMDKKPSKSDIIAARFAHGDIDPPKNGTAFDQAEILDLVTTLWPSPSFIIHSGNGLQAFWRFDEEVQDLDAVEQLNRRISAAFNGDNCHNADRLMRLPGTVNYPTETKRANGRVPALATVLAADTGKSFSLVELDAALPPPPTQRQPNVCERGQIAVGESVPLTANDLGLEAFSPLRSLIDHPHGVDQSADTLALAGAMQRTGYTRAQALGVLLNPHNAVSAHCLGQRDPRRAACRAIEQAFGADDRPMIRVRPGALHIMATEGERALIQTRAPLYVRGNKIVRPVIEDLPAADGRRTKVARVAVVSAEGLRDHLSRAANWKRYDVRSKKDVPTDPSIDLAKVILARDGQWELPRIAGVITTPTLRPDGTILATPGFDAETGLLLLDPLELPPIADRPTRANAAAGLALLLELIEGFPFVNEASRSVALSMLITPIVRGAMAVAPMHVVRAPVAGSGKSYLVDLAHAILTGDRAPVFAAGRNEEETEKRLVGAMITGQPIISIDNVNGKLGGDLLCQMIERPVVSVRQLGASQPLKIESRATTFATGNNIHLEEDMTRRVVQCELDPEMERPELRTFATDPLGMIGRRRGDYVAAALTIVRAYIVAGYPGRLSPLASFEQWSHLVRSAIVWLGQADAVATMDSVRSNDPKRRAFEALVVAWHGELGEQARFAGEVKNHAELAEGDLHRALVEVAHDRGSDYRVDGVRLGIYLANHENRISGGLKLVAELDTHAKRKRWRVVRVVRRDAVDGANDLLG